MWENWGDRKEKKELFRKIGASMSFECCYQIDYFLVKIKCPYSYQFRCGYRGRCIPRSWICNGARNCADGSDEAAELCSMYAILIDSIGIMHHCALANDRSFKSL